MIFQTLAKREIAGKLIAAYKAYPSNWQIPCSPSSHQQHAYTIRPEAYHFQLPKALALLRCILSTLQLARRTWNFASNKYPRHPLHLSDLTLWSYLLHLKKASFPPPYSIGVCTSLSFIESLLKIILILITHQVKNGRLMALADPEQSSSSKTWVTSCNGFYPRCDNRPALTPGCCIKHLLHSRIYDQTERGGSVVPVDDSNWRRPSINFARPSRCNAWRSIWRACRDFPTWLMRTGPHFCRKVGKRSGENCLISPSVLPIKNRQDLPPLT